MSKRHLCALVFLLWMIMSTAAWAFDADLTIKEVTISDTTPDEGQTITITVVEAENKGPTDSVPAVIVDMPLPSGLTYVSDDSGGSYNFTTGVWSIGSLLDGPKVSLVITAAVDFGTGGSTLTPTASVSSTDPAYNETNGGNNTRLRNLIVNAADLRITKTVNDTTPDEGQTVTFTIKVMNLGEAGADNIFIGDLLPTTLTWVSDTANQGTYDEVTGEWDVDTLAKGVEKTLTIVAIVNAGTAGTDITNTARVNSVDQTDDDLTNNSASVEMLVATPDLLVTKKVNDSTPDELQIIEYEIRVENLGPAQATGVEITDLLPAGVTFSSTLTIEQGTYEPITGIWDVGTLENGDKPKLVIVAIVDAGTAAQVIQNTASVSDLVQTDGDLSNNLASVDIFVNGADLVVTKTVDNQVPAESGTIFYTIRVDNNGPLKAPKNTEITDLLPSGVTYVSHSASEGSYIPGSGVWTIDKDINNGAFQMLVIEATVDPGTKGSAIVNTAAVTAAVNADSLTANNSDDALIVIGDADPTAIKTVNVTTVDELDTVTYTITVLNNGPDAAAGFIVNDPLPAGVTYSSQTLTPNSGSFDPVTGIWDFGSDFLPNGNSAVLTIDVIVSSGTAAQTIINAATLVPIQSGNDPANDVDSASFQVNGADIEVTKTVDNERPAAGAPYTYTITVTNNGPDDATGIEVTDKLPFGVKYVSDLPSQGSYDSASGVWTVGALINGASVTLDIDATTGISTVNTATKTGADQPDSATANDTDSVTVASNITFGAGSCIIDMGVGVEQPDPLNPTVFQGYDKGLEPYSLLYELISNFRIPIYWAINPDKTGFMPPPKPLADYSAFLPSLDFTAGGKNYYGGSFIVDVAFITPEIQSLLNTWDPDGNGTGPTVDCPVSDFTAPIYNTVTSFPRAVLDEANGDKIESAFYHESWVPAESYRIGSPEDLTLCDDLYAMPHADPQGWQDSYLTALQGYINSGGSLWAACHAVSALETLADVPTADGTNDFNLLSNRGLVEWGEHNDGTPVDGDPTDYRYEGSTGADPIMQFISSFDGSIQNGSEQIFLPLLDPIITQTGELPTITEDPLARLGGWRSSTTIGVWDPGHPDVENVDPTKIKSPGLPALLTFGRAYGDETLGTIVYEASHTVAGGSEFENTSAARVYGNLLLKVGIDRRPNIEMTIDNETLVLGETTGITTTIAGSDPGYTYEWSDSCGGTFSPSIIDPNPTYTAPTTLTESTTCVLRVVVSDMCNRANFDARLVQVILPSVSGNVFNDIDGNSTIDGPGTDAGGLFVSLVDNAGNVVQSLPVNPDGSYTFSDVQSGDFTVQLNTTVQTVGVSPAAPDLSSGWVNVGENLGAGAGNDGAADGILAVTVGTDDVSDANFGVEVTPTIQLTKQIVSSTGSDTFEFEFYDDLNNLIASEIGIPDGGSTAVILFPSGSGITVEEDSSGLPAFDTAVLQCFDGIGNEVVLDTQLVPAVNNPVVFNTIPRPSTLIALEKQYSCTVFNIRNAKLAVAKTTIPASDTTTVFKFDVTWDGGVESQQPMLTNGSAEEIDLGNYSGDVTITELPLPATWTLQGHTCVYLTDSVSGASLGDIVLGTNNTNDPLTIAFASGDEILCSYMNIKDFGVTLAKTWVGGNPGDEVDITVADGVISYTYDQLIADGTNKTDTDTVATIIQPGETVSVSEVGVGATNLNGYASSYQCTSTGGATVGSGSTTSGAFVMPADDVTCTFTNDYLPIATNDNSSGNDIGDPVTLDVTANDTTGGSVDPTTVSLAGICDAGQTNANGDCLQITVPGQGAWTVNSVTGEVTFTPEVSFTGNPTPINYTVEDGEGNTSNEATITIDYQLAAHVSGMVWLDEDQDGILDIEETTFTNATVELQDGSCTPLFNVGANCPTVQTDQYGNYAFDNLASGDYDIVVIENTLPTGITNTAGQYGFPIRSISLAGGDLSDENFGYIANPDTGIIGDRVWSDADADGVQDEGETGIAGITVELLDDSGSVIATTATGPDGDYFFTNVLYGEDYVVRVDAADPELAGFSPTSGPQSEGGFNSNPVTLSASLTTVTDLDFGFNSADTLTIIDRIWYDSNGDGVDDAGELGIAAVSINLLDSAGNVVATAVSAADGSITFSGVPEGLDYSLAISDRDNNLGGMTETTSTGGSAQISGSLDTAAGTDNILDTVGDDGTSSFGFNNPGSIAGTVWNDVDGDGLQNNGEPGLAGVSVTIDPPAGVDLGAGDGNPITIVTETDGSYFIDGLPPGDYDIDILSADRPVGIHTEDPDGNDDHNTTVSLGVGEGAANQDFGYQDTSLSDISGTIFLDTDKDGVEEAGEPGIPEVTVALIDCGSGTCSDGDETVIVSTIADSNGEYTFLGLPDGNYLVAVTDDTGQLAGYDITGSLDQIPVTLASADSDDVDFGYIKDEATGSIRGEVFIDEFDFNSLADDAETNLSGITMYLCAAEDAPCTAGNAIATTTTDANGEYGFTGLNSGQYAIDADPATIPSGLTLTVEPAPIALSEGEEVTDIDVGYVPAAATGVLSGFVWTDVDGDGVHDNGEAPVPGVDIFVYSNDGVTLTLIATGTTKPDGTWIVTGISGAGLQDDLLITYDDADIPAALEPVQPTNLPLGDDLYSPVDLLSDDDNNISYLDFGFQPKVGSDLGSIAGTIYSDADEDGSYVALTDGELAGVTINLLDSGVNVIATTITDANGNYIFSGLADDAVGYTVVVTDLDNVLGDLNPLEIISNPISIVGGADITDQNAGYASNTTFGSVGNKFWFDTNGDGIADDDEPGVEGVTVRCWLDNAPLQSSPNDPSISYADPVPGEDNLIRTITTDENGEYYCTNLPTGQYIVQVFDAVGFDEMTDATTYSGLNPEDDNRAKPWLYVLTTNSPNFTADFGVTGSNSINGSVFIEDIDLADASPPYDAGGGVPGVEDGGKLDGLADGVNDVGAEGVQVVLLLSQPDGTYVEVQSTLTGTNGDYSFSGLPDGDYRVEVHPSGSVIDGFGQTADPDLAVMAYPDNVCDSPTAAECDDGTEVSLSGAVVTDIDFGYQEDFVTTPVTINLFTTTDTGGGVAFGWESSNEVGHIGYQVYARTADEWVLLNEELIVNSDSGDALQTRNYQYRAYNVDAMWFALVDVSAAEELAIHGPYKLNESYGEKLVEPDEFDWSGISPSSPGEAEISASVQGRLQRALLFDDPDDDIEVDPSDIDYDYEFEDEGEE